jgi:hypothetical protein
MKSAAFLFCFLLLSGTSIAQSGFDTLAIQTELRAILERDQKTRTGVDSASFMQFIDSTNLVRVEAILAQYGWLGRSAIGAEANSTLFFLIQHADLETQLKYFPILQRSVEMGESKMSHMALMQDRILMRQGKKQIYGSQVVINKTTGAQEFHPIEDEKNVNVRRAKMGMQTLEEYAKFFGLEYILPTE